MVYTNKLLEVFYNQKNVGFIKGASASAKQTSKECGDILKLYVSIINNKIVNAKYEVFGSVMAFAAMNSIVELVVGKRVEELSEIKYSDLTDKLGEFAKTKTPIVSLAYQTIAKLIEDIKENQINISSPKIFESKAENIAEEKPIQKEKEIEISVIESKTNELIKQDADKEADKKVKKELKIKSSSRIPTNSKKVIIPNKSEISFEEALATNSNKEKNKNNNKEVVVKVNEDFDMVDEIDSITARLSEAISKLNFKSDDNDDE